MISKSNKCTLYKSLVCISKLNKINCEIIHNFPGAALRRIFSFLLASTLLLTACAHNAKAVAAPEPEVSTAPAQATAAPSLNECVNCHTDKQRLIDTARPEEVAVKESSGAG